MNRKNSINSFSFLKSHRRARSRGFTILELVVSITVIGILGAVVGPRMMSRGVSTIPIQADLLARNIRHVQNLSLTWSQPLKINLLGNSYTVSCVTATGKWPCLNDPIMDSDSHKTFSVALTDGVTISGATIAFDSMGRPIDPASTNLISATQSVSLGVSGEVWRLDIYPVTGFVSTVRL